MLRGLVAALLLVACYRPALAQIETGCAYEVFRGSYYLDGGRRVFDESRHTALAFKLETPIYKAADGSDIVAGRPLNFSERVRISDPGEGTGRLQIKEHATSRLLGWVNRGEVLCRILPLIDSGHHLYRRAVVRTDPAERGQVKPKKVFHGPDGRCERGEQSCIEVTRMRWYFVYGEENGHLLVSEFAQIGNPDTRLLGWLPIGDAIGWSTSLGLRPSEELAKRPGPNNAPESHICAFKTRADASDASKCNQVLGGKRWFTKETRMLVLNQDNEGYDVAFTSAASADRDYSRLVEPVRNVDVFFVIDGTQSMGPAIQGVKDTVKDVMTALKGRMQRGGSVRFGYRVYRDSVRGGPDGVQNSERLLFDAAKCTAANDDEFSRSFASVTAKDPDGDPDYSENTFGGLLQAAEDLSACSDNVKLVFVIGDHGYDPAAQTSRGHRSLSVSQVAARFKRDGNDPQRFSPRFTNPPLIYFLQTPSKCEGPTCKQADYDNAYRAFERQALELLSEIYAGRAGRQPSDSFMRLEASNVSRAVVDRISQQVGIYLQPSATSELISRLSAGQSLVAAINALQKDSNLDIPIGWSQLVEEALCRRLGEQCRTAVIQAVNEAFVPKRHDPDIVHELLISTGQLTKWINVLDKFKQFFGGGMGARERRTQTVNALFTGLSAVLQTGELGNDSISLSQRAQLQANLPAAARSPLLKYSSNDLLSEHTPACELEYLGVYGIKRYDILHAIQDGATLVDFMEVRVPPGTCPGMSDIGKQVPFIEGQVIPRRIAGAGEEVDYKLWHLRGDERWLWIPVRYMP